MPFSLFAHLPLGVYRGRRPDLTPERIPSVARLHAALLCAAGFGPRAVERADGWAPCDIDDVALRWLEENPPTDVRIPRLRVSRNDAIAYRDDGTIGKSKQGKAIRKLPKQESVVAVDGPFVWTWREPPPDPVAAALRELCADVSHLGTAESPVVLTAADDAGSSTHERITGSSVFTAEPGHDIDVPLPGRLEELGRAHHTERAGKVGSDKAGTDERSLSPVPPRQAVTVARYRQTAAPIGAVPWSEVLIVPLDRPVATRDRVRCAVAAHRALIRLLDRSSPAVLTGAYPDGVRRPPNRIALHLLTAEMPVRLPGGAGSALAVMIPRDTEPSELDAVYSSVGALRSLRVRRTEGPDADGLRVIGGVEVVPGDRFWRAPEPGTIRLWRTEPPAVPDTRGHAGWTFAHAALLSLGFVWQGLGLPAMVGRGATRDAGIVDAVNAAGAVVLSTDPVRSSRVGDFVHRVHRDAVVRPYGATLALGDLGGDTVLQAIGQCRHLGGGLLVPHDYEEGEYFSGAAG